MNVNQQRQRTAIALRILLIHPNYHSGGAEIAGNWPPAWVAYLAGALKSAGYPDVRFIDAMTNTSDRRGAGAPHRARSSPTSSAPPPSRLRSTRPSAPCRSPRKSHPDVVTLLGGVHATFMFKQVLSEAPWIDAIVRGEGEEILVEVVRAIDTGDWAERRRDDQGPGLRRKGGATARAHRRHRGRADRQGSRRDRSRLGHPRVEQIQIHSAELPGRHPQHGARLPVHLLVLLAVEVLARLSRPRPEEGRRRNPDALREARCRASSSSPTRSRPSTARSSCSSARN